MQNNPFLTSQVLDTCCGDTGCAGFSYSQDGTSGCYKRNADCGFVSDSAYDGFYK
jgi:hypothetical protein